MKLIKKIFIPTIALTSVTPALFVISCSSSSSDTTNKLQQTIDLIDFFKNDKNSISAKPEKTNIKNFVQINSWKNQDDFVSKLEQYFSVSTSFKNILSEKDIYPKIKKLVIQPKVGSTDLVVIFYLGSSTNDTNVVQHIVTNALTSPFAYAAQIDVPSSIKTEQYTDEKNFNDAWNLIKDKKEGYQNELKIMLKKAFNLTNENINKIVDNFEKYFSISKNSSNQILLSINQDGLNEGYIFYREVENTLSYKNSIISESLFVKE